MEDYQKEKYPEIVELFDYCKKIGVTAVLENLYDGYAIRFNDGSDVIQHCYSRGARYGYVETAIGSVCDYNPVTTETAKRLIRHRRLLMNKMYTVKK